MKKFLFITIILLGTLQAKYNGGLIVSNSVGLTLGYDLYKLELYDGYVSIDRYLQNTKLQNDLSWYYGGGLGIHWAKNNAFDLRGIVGLDWTMHPHFDLYVEAVPALSLSNVVSFGVSYTLGVRYIF